MKRRFPRPRDLAPLMKFKKPTLNAKKRRLQEALTIYDLKRIAQRRTPKAAFDYTDGAAEAELSLTRARQAFEDIQFNPAILRDVSSIDTTREVLGGPVALPFGIAPTGFTRMMQTEGEIAGASAAGAQRRGRAHRRGRGRIAVGGHRLDRPGRVGVAGGVAPMVGRELGAASAPFVAGRRLTPSGLTCQPWRVGRLAPSPPEPVVGWRAASGKPAVREPTTQNSVTREPATRKPVTREPATREPRPPGRLGVENLT